MRSGPSPARDSSGLSIWPFPCLLERIITTSTSVAAPPWIGVVTKYHTPHTLKAVGQICSSVLPFLLAWVLMVWSLRVHYGLTLLLALPAVGLLIRTFIIRHDCGHGYRHPIVLFVVGPAFQLFVLHRFPSKKLFAWNRDRASVLWTNLILVGLYGFLGAWLGWRTVVMVQLPIVVLAASIGTWLFYVQHQFEGTYWAKGRRRL